LDDDGQRGERQGQRRRRQQFLRREHPSPRIDHDAESHRDQHEPHADGGQRFDAAVTVGVKRVRGHVGLARGEQHQEIARQVGQRVHAVGDERLGLGQPAADHLREGEKEIDERADQRHAAHGPVALLARASRRHESLREGSCKRQVYASRPRGGHPPGCRQ
jgi:hypothetical protein